MRGLDYYRHTAFEFVTDRLGAQGTVLAGGRYDGLIEALGGPHTPAVGWAAGIERLAMLIEAPAAGDSPMRSIVPLGERAESEAQRILAGLRREGIAADMAYRGNIEEAARARRECIRRAPRADPRRRRSSTAVRRSSRILGERRAARASRST